MKFSVLALDFDGRIARHDRLDDAVREAIADVRARGVVVILVTGRILEDLRRVTGGLHFVDAVGAENGAVVEFPASGYTTRNGSPPAPAFLYALGQAGVRVDTGTVAVEADASQAPATLDVIRRLELPLSIVFNRSRLMVLPQTISKASGLRQALAVLRLSPRNALGIGDAENDHDLLQVCEVGVAVGWGSAALQAAADDVLPGTGPAAVADYIRRLAVDRLLPVPTRTRRRLRLGHDATGTPFELAVRGRNVLVAGAPKSGKSWVAGLLCEQLILHGYSLCILDPEGDYVALEALPGVTVLGGADPLPRPADVVRALRHADVSVVIDLSRVAHDPKVAYMRNLLPALNVLRRHTGIPHRIIVDEAHYFLYDTDVPELLDLEINGYTLVSYRASKLHPAALASTQVIVVTRESDPYEADALLTLCPTCAGRPVASTWRHLLGGLDIDEAAILPVTEETQGGVRRIRLAPRLTPHVRHQAKYIDVPIGESLGFVVWHDGAPTTHRIRTLREFVTVIESTRTARLHGHLVRNDFSRWIADVFGDFVLAETIRAAETDYRRGQLAEPMAVMAQAVRSRYEFVDGPWW